MLINYFLTMLIGGLAGAVSIFLLKRLVSRYKILTPGVIPLIGGVCMGMSFILACLFGSFFYKNLFSETKGILFASGIMLVFGVVDDWRELSVGAKFLMQIIATSVLILFGIRTQIVYIGNLFNIIITFIWILGIANAFNHLDVLDGVAGAVGIIVSLAFLTISLLGNNVSITILSLSLIGAILGFLIFNFPPARVYMGNSGSHFLGFMLASVALSVSYAPLERKVALLSPLLILGVPIFDTAFISLLRLSRKRLPFKKSNDHLALRFLTLGYSKKKTLMVMSALCLFFSLCGVIISQASNFLGIIIVVFAVIISLIIAYRMGKVKLSD